MTKCKQMMAQHEAREEGVATSGKKLYNAWKTFMTPECSWNLSRVTHATNRALSFERERVSAWKPVFLLAFCLAGLRNLPKLHFLLRCTCGGPRALSLFLRGFGLFSLFFFFFGPPNFQLPQLSRNCCGNRKNSSNALVAGCCAPLWGINNASISWPQANPVNLCDRRSCDAVRSLHSLKWNFLVQRMITAPMVILLPLLPFKFGLFSYFSLWPLKTTLLIKLRQIKRRITNWFAMNAEEMLASE